MVNVLWQKGILIPRTSNPARRERFYPVSCSKCGEWRLLRAHDARKAIAEDRVCATCQRSAAGRLGFEASMQKYGKDFVINRFLGAREYRIQNPSQLERQVAQALDNAKVRYEREVLFTTPDDRIMTAFDFLIEGWLYVEVDGEYIHSKPDVKKRTEFVRAELTQAGHSLLVLTEREVAGGKVMNRINLALALGEEGQYGKAETA